MVNNSSLIHTKNSEGINLLDSNHSIMTQVVNCSSLNLFIEANSSNVVLAEGGKKLLFLSNYLDQCNCSKDEKESATNVSNNLFKRKKVHYITTCKMSRNIKINTSEY